MLIDYQTVLFPYDALANVVLKSVVIKPAAIPWKFTCFIMIQFCSPVIAIVDIILLLVFSFKKILEYTYPL